jgi:hypothetical protein
MVRGEETFMVHVIDKRKTKMRESARTEDKKGQAQPAQPKPPVPQPITSPQKDKPIPRPPRSNFESTVYDFFKIGSK